MPTHTTIYQGVGTAVYPLMALFLWVDDDPLHLFGGKRPKIILIAKSGFPY